MDGIINTLTIFQITFYSLVIVCSCVYLLPLLLIRRFHTSINIVTGNVCVTIFAFAFHWIVNNVVIVYFPKLYNANLNLCTFKKYIQTVVLCQVPHSLVLVSIHRLCIVVYQRKASLKTKKWAFMCVGTQWVFSTIIMLPIFYISAWACSYATPPWCNAYLLVIICILPCILLGLINTLIFVYARASTRRVVPTEGTMGNAIVPLSNRDSRVLKYMLFMFLIFIAGWVFIFACLLAKPPWFTFLVFDFMQLLPALSMLIDIGDLFFYNHQLRNYWKEKISMGQRHVGKSVVLGTVAQYGQPKSIKN